MQEWNAITLTANGDEGRSVPCLGTSALLQRTESSRTALTSNLREIHGVTKDARQQIENQETVQDAQRRGL